MFGNILQLEAPRFHDAEALLLIGDYPFGDEQPGLS